MDKCQRCFVEEEDMRDLYMSCLYEMHELKIPLTEIEGIDKRTFYMLRVCKDCRADWLIAIKDWFNHFKCRGPSCGSGIFIREFGAIKEVTEEEFNEYRKGKANERMD